MPVNCRPLSRPSSWPRCSTAHPCLSPRKKPSPDHQTVSPQLGNVTGPRADMWPLSRCRDERHPAQFRFVPDIKKKRVSCLVYSTCWLPGAVIPRLSCSQELEDIRRDQERPRRTRNGDFCCVAFGEAFKSSKLMSDMLRFRSGALGLGCVTETVAVCRRFGGVKGDGSCCRACCFFEVRVFVGVATSATSISWASRDASLNGRFTSASETSLKDGSKRSRMNVNGKSISSPTNDSSRG